MSDSVKREAGERPARSRRCERGALFPLHRQCSVTENRTISGNGFRKDINECALRLEESWEDEVR